MLREKWENEKKKHGACIELETSFDFKGKIISLQIVEIVLKTAYFFAKQQ